MECIGTSSKVFQSLVKALELDTEWHRAVTNATYAFAISNRGPTLKSPSGEAQWPLRDPHPDSGCSFPCPQCGTVIVNLSQHILNTCGAFQDRYAWRRANIINYMDSILDHNKYKVFCDLPDRKTSTGGTIPLELLPTSADGSEVYQTSLKPSLVVIHRQTRDIHIFVLSVADESQISEVQKSVWESYYDLIESLSAKAGADFKVLFHTIEIGAFTGSISESTKFSIWEVYKLSRGDTPIHQFMDNVVLLSKLGSFMIFKWKNDKKWKRNTPLLHPTTLAAKQKRFVRDYLIPFGKAVGILAALAAVIFLMHLGYVMSGWLWAHLTFKVMLFIYVTLMGLFLALFRP